MGDIGPKKAYDQIMGISPDNQYMDVNGNFRYDLEDEPDLIGLYCGECENEWGNMPVCPHCGSGSELWSINKDAEEVLRYFVKSGMSSFFTNEKIDELTSENR
jgi:hypothetical protein